MASEFVQRGISTTVVGPKVPEAISYGDFGERVINVASTPSVPGGLQPLVQSRVWWSAARVIRCLASEIDVVLLMACVTSALGLRTAMLKGLGRRPLVLYVTGLGRPRVGYRLGLSANRILIGSEFLQQWFPGAGIIYPFLSVSMKLDETEMSEQDGDGVFKVLCLGSLEPGRGVEYLLRAMALVRKQVDDRAKLIIAWNGKGGRNYQNIQRLIDELDIRGIVDWRGRVNVSSLYRESDVVVIPRATEERMSFPVRIVEALHMRKPVIVSRICGMEGLVEGCGLAVKPRDAGSLARAILDLAHNTALREQLAENCTQVVRRFDSRVSLDRLISELRKVASDGR
jgi:glycosyltransferase involved in cell wall biosynthesis